jgi:flagellar biogenesis protein FliO
MSDVLVYLIGVACLAAAVVAVAYLVRRIFVGAPLLATFFASKPGRRIEIVEQATIDARRRLVLVRRDDVEHLVMTGGPADVVIETGIRVTRATAAEPRQASLFSRPPRPLERAAGDR